MKNSNEAVIQKFWQENPCGENLTGKLEDWSQHFVEYDKFRYGTEGHILLQLDQIDFKEKKILEIGVGQAADSLQIAKRGALWNGLDLTDAAVNRAKIRFALNDQLFGEVKKGSAVQIPWEDNSFDIVYSHGVLHHIPEIERVSSEISRILKPGGRLVVMMYHQNSLNYYVSIAFIRRIGLVVFWVLDKCGFAKLFSSDVIVGHLSNIKKYGLLNYLKIRNFIHHNTDGPSNPFSRVYTIARVSKDFPQFMLEKSSVHFINTRHFPGISFLPKALYKFLESRYGWHLWATLTNDKK